MLNESTAIELGTLISILGPLFGVAGTLAVIKWRQNHLEEQQKESQSSWRRDGEKLERVDEKIFDEIRNLNKTVQRRFNEQDRRAADSEKSMIGRIDGFQSKVFTRLDDMQGQLSEQDKRLTVAETEARHVREQVQKHAQKITLYGNKAVVPKPKDD